MRQYMYMASQSIRGPISPAARAFRRRRRGRGPYARADDGPAAAARLRGDARRVERRRRPLGAHGRGRARSPGATCAPASATTSASALAPARATRAACGLRLLNRDSVLPSLHVVCVSADVDPSTPGALRGPAPPLHGIRVRRRRRGAGRSRVRPSRELLPLVVEEAAERALVESREAQRLAHQVIAVGVGADPAHVHAEIAERAHLRRTTRARGSRARAACSARKRGALARASAPSRCRRRTNRPRRSIPCRPLCAARPGTYTCARETEKRAGRTCIGGERRA